MILKIVVYPDILEIASLNIALRLTLLCICGSRLLVCPRVCPVLAVSRIR